MFGWLGRLLGSTLQPKRGAGPASQLPEARPAAIPDRPAPERPTFGGVVRIEVLLPAGRDLAGVLTALDARGTILSGPWPALGRADAGLAAANGNAGRDPLRRHGDTPTGEYEIIRRVPGHDRLERQRVFGMLGALVLRPVSGQALEARANGRSEILLHGGPLTDAATDGSLRIPEEAMVELLSLLPEDVASRAPRIRVVIVQASDSLAAWTPGRLEFRTEHASPAAAQHAASSSGSHRVCSRAEDQFPGYDLWPGYRWWYLHGQDLDDGMAEPHGQGREHRKHEKQDGTLKSADWQTEDDRAAAEGLAGMGYAVLPDGEAAPKPEPARHLDLTPGAPKQQPGAADWAPTGNAYDR